MFHVVPDLFFVDVFSSPPFQDVGGNAGQTGELFGEGWGAGFRDPDTGNFMDVCGVTENTLFGTTGPQNIELLDFRGVDGDARVRADSIVKCGALGLLKIRHQFRSAQDRPGCESVLP
jgi:hypothetical protein